MPLVVGMTGGIGAGKTLVAEAFADLGVEIIDTDRLARELTAPGEPVLMEIASQFGKELLTADGSLDRASLRRRVFADSRARRQLESLLHPLIEQEVHRLLKLAQGPYVLLVVPLLIETGHWEGTVDRVLVVDCPEDLQVARVMLRSGLGRGEVEAIQQAQASRAQRLARADDVLTNDADLDTLHAGVKRLHREYLSLAAARTGK